MYACIPITYVCKPHARSEPKLPFSNLPLKRTHTHTHIYIYIKPLPPPHKLAFPWLSNGSAKTSSPDAMNSAPLTYTGALVSKFANMATMGAMMPKTRLADAVMALPVPRSLVGKISGV